MTYFQFCSCRSTLQQASRRILFVEGNRRVDMCGRQVSKLVLSNLAWFICGGFMIWLEYLMVGVVFMLTIVLAKPGYSILKLSALIFAPLGADWATIVETSVCVS
jgi:hypothetical protein